MFRIVRWPVQVNPDKMKQFKRRVSTVVVKRSGIKRSP